MKNKIAEFRKIVPVPMGEALVMLKENKGDIEKCVYLFKAKSIREICQQTDCDVSMATHYYEQEQYDMQKAISAIRDELFDRNYIPIDGLTASMIQTVYRWFDRIEETDLAAALDHAQLETVMTTFSLIPELQNLVEIVKNAKKGKDLIFAGYSDSAPLQDFVRRHAQMDDDPAFQELYTQINLRLTVIEKILSKHLRNILKAQLK